MGLDTGIPGDTLLRFQMRDYDLIWRQGKWPQEVFEWFRLSEHNTLCPLRLYCSWKSCCTKLSDLKWVCVSVCKNMTGGEVRWLVWALLWAKGSDHIGRVHWGDATMSSTVACGVGLSGIMTPTDFVMTIMPWPYPSYPQRLRYRSSPEQPWTLIRPLLPPSSAIISALATTSHHRPLLRTPPPLKSKSLTIGLRQD
jgi:hypothetical protein